MSDFNAIDSILGTTSSSLTGLGALGAGNASLFESALNAAESSTSDPAQRAQLQYLDTRYQVQQTLWNLGSTDSNSGSSTSTLWDMTVQSMFAPGGSLAIPSWVNDAERVMGSAFPSQVVNLYAQASGLLTGHSSFSSLF